MNHKINWKITELGNVSIHEGIVDGKYMFNMAAEHNNVFLVDLREYPAKYFKFSNIGMARTLAQESLEDESVLEPFVDREWTRQMQQGQQMIKSAESILEHVKSTQ